VCKDGENSEAARLSGGARNQLAVGEQRQSADEPEFNLYQ
jgi:hypothetical protein